MKRYRRSTVPTHAHPIVRWIYSECIRQQISPGDLSERAGLTRSAVNGMRRHQPTLANLEAVINALGADLKPIRRSESDG